MRNLSPAPQNPRRPEWRSAPQARGQSVQWLRLAEKDIGTGKSTGIFIFHHSTKNESLIPPLPATGPPRFAAQGIARPRGAHPGRPPLIARGDFAMRSSSFLIRAARDVVSPAFQGPQATDRRELVPWPRKTARPDCRRRLHVALAARGRSPPGARGFPFERPPPPPEFPSPKGAWPASRTGPPPAADRIPGGDGPGSCAQAGKNDNSRPVPDVKKDMPACRGRHSFFVRARDAARAPCRFRPVPDVNLSSGVFGRL